MTSKKKVMDVLTSKREGLTMAEIAQLSQLSKPTVRIVIAELNGSGMLNIRRIGNAKLIYLLKNTGENN